jgi:hypothetical protein
MRLKHEETELRGFWIDLGSSMVPDASWDRIDYLTKESLELVETLADGAASLYRDPADGRLWELTKVAPQMKDGGPPRLTVIEAGEAAKKFVKPAGR